MAEYHAGIGKDCVTPPKDPSIAKYLWKIAILRSKKKYTKARSAALCLRKRY